MGGSVEPPADRCAPMMSTESDDDANRGGDSPSDAPEDRPARDVVIIFAVFFEGGLAPLSLFLGWLLSRNPLEHFAWNPLDAGLGVVAAMPLLALFIAMLRWPIGPLSRVRKFCDVEVAPLFSHRSWSELALISVAAGVGEEMLFRGVAQASLAGWLGTTWGLTLASLLFGLFHPISMTYMVLAAIMGFYLGALSISNGNLLTVMIAHAVYDLAALGYLVKFHTADPRP